MTLFIRIYLSPNMIQTPKLLSYNNRTVKNDIIKYLGHVRDSFKVFQTNSLNFLTKISNILWVSVLIVSVWTVSCFNFLYIWWSKVLHNYLLSLILSHHTMFLPVYLVFFSCVSRLVWVCICQSTNPVSTVTLRHPLFLHKYYFLQLF